MLLRDQKRLTEQSDSASCTGKDTESTLVVGLDTVLNGADQETSTGAGSTCGHAIGKGRSLREGLSDDLLVVLVGHDDKR